MLPSRTHEPALAGVCLKEDEVHLWWGRDAVESLDALRTSLSDEEWRRAERFRRERDARAFLFRRAFLRRVLAGYVGGEPRQLVFIQNEFGKPFLARRDTNLRFNATSSRGLVLLGLSSGREIGVDLEHEDGLGDEEGLSGLARRILTPGELHTFELLGCEERTRALLRAWTRKEAVLKALGTGLSRAPNTVEVGLAELGAAREGPGATEASWTGWGQAFEPGALAGFLAALVVAARPGQRTGPPRPRLVIRQPCGPPCPEP